MEQRQIAQMLKQTRIERGITIKVLAERTGLSPQYIWYVERGQRRPTLETLECICAFLGIDIKFIKK